MFCGLSGVNGCLIFGHRTLVSGAPFLGGLGRSNTEVKDVIQSTSACRIHQVYEASEYVSKVDPVVLPSMPINNVSDAVPL